ncbi:DUF5317 domain-containing protein [Kribbella solani]|uniref:DUF5317 domain-containing protein n=1 Tax=Kribbella solani TaxID=236067 RepID=A0A841DZ20_9ACTN|nr:hypothetical protein [Kribbella solani]
MLLVLLVMVLAAGVALATGGRFGQLGSNSLTGVHWLAAAAIGQLLGSLLGGNAYPVGLIGSAVCIAVFLRLNLRHPGVGLLAVGFFANALVVALNGAMPVSLAALQRAGVGNAAITDPRHELTHAATILPWLGDVVPVALPHVGQAVSPGDVLIAAGAGLLLYTGMGASGRVPTTTAPTWPHLEPCAGTPALLHLSPQATRQLTTGQQPNNGNPRTASTPADHRPSAGPDNRPADPDDPTPSGDRAGRHSRRPAVDGAEQQSPGLSSPAALPGSTSSGLGSEAEAAADDSA